MVSELGFDLKPQRFTFQRRGVKYLFAEPNDGTGDVRVYYASGAYYTVNDVVLGDGIRALLAERTRRADVFARLMEVARDNISHVNQDRAEEMIASDKLDALQSEWDGAQEGRVK